MHPDTDAPFEEHVIAVRSFPNLHLEFYELDVTDSSHVTLVLCAYVSQKTKKERRGEERRGRTDDMN